MTKVQFLNALKILIVFFVLLSSHDINGQSRRVRKAIRHAEKVERQEENTYNRSKEKAIKDHYKRQSDSTKEQMARSKKNSEQYRKQKKDNIIEAYIKKRKIKKEQKKRSKRQKRR